MVGIWNELPEEVVKTGTITLKIHLHRYMDRKVLEGIYAKDKLVGLA